MRASPPPISKQKKFVSEKFCLFVFSLPCLKDSSHTSRNFTAVDITLGPPFADKVSTRHTKGCRWPSQGLRLSASIIRFGKCFFFKLFLLFYVFTGEGCRSPSGDRRRRPVALDHLAAADQGLQAGRPHSQRHGVLQAGSHRAQAAGH